MTLANTGQQAHAGTVARPSRSVLPVVDLPRPAAARASTAGRAAASVQAISSATAPRAEIPERYTIREKDGVRFIECDEAPRVRAVIDPQMSISRSAAASLGPRAILLDGAGSFGPLIDNEEKLYNLDHHVGCERLFTLSTCEQALLLVYSGLELSEGDWKIYANEPDLDTILALWCLLNYRRVKELSPEARDVLLPLFRLEGAIDANGPKLAALCGLSNELLEQTTRRIDVLLARERELKQSGSWAKKKLYPYTLEMLCAVDALMYAGEDFGDHTRIDEIYGHVEVRPRQVAVVCRDRAGIYTVEQHLKSRWGDQLSLIALENEPGQYTLRRVSTLAGPKLGPAYDRLNRLDGAVDGRPVGKRWGGSEDIGGSPRPTGTQFSAEELLDELARSYRPFTWWTRTGRTLGAGLLGLSCLGLWMLTWVLPSPVEGSSLPAGVKASYQLGLTSLLVLLVGMLVMRLAGRGRPWVFGWRPPVNGGGHWLLPLASFGALPVSAWVSTWVSASLSASISIPAFASTSSGALTFVSVLAAGSLTLAAGEVWFRGVVHGLLVPDFAVQRPLGKWLLSRAAFASSLAYALVATMMSIPVIDSPLLAPFGATEVELVAGIAGLAFLCGMVLAILRERSLSLLSGLIAQWAALVLATAIGAWLL